MDRFSRIHVIDHGDGRVLIDTLFRGKQMAIGSHRVLQHLVPGLDGAQGQPSRAVEEVDLPVAVHADENSALGHDRLADLAGILRNMLKSRSAPRVDLILPRKVTHRNEVGSANDVLDLRTCFVPAYFKVSSDVVEYETALVAICVSDYGGVGNSIEALLLVWQFALGDAVEILAKGMLFVEIHELWEYGDNRVGCGYHDCLERLLDWFFLIQLPNF